MNKRKPIANSKPAKEDNILCWPDSRKQLKSNQDYKQRLKNRQLSKPKD